MKTIVLALHACPVGALACYGNEWVATPNLDRLAAASAVFDQHYADAPDLAAASRAWLSGRRQHPTLDAEVPVPTADLLTSLRAGGTVTVLVRHARAGNDSPIPFYADWGEMFDARPAGQARPSVDGLLQALEQVRQKLAGHDDWLLWVEIDWLLPPWDIPQGVFDAYIEGLFEDESEPTPATTKQAAEYDDDTEDDEDDEPVVGPEPIEPWADPPSGWFDTADLASWELLHRSFAAAVTTFDADLGRVLGFVERVGWDQSAATVFTAAHGLPLGEHGVVRDFRPWMHEESIHLPLIVRLPGGEQAGRRVGEFTQTPDLMPTLLALHGREVPAGLGGVDLTPLLRGQEIGPREIYGGLEQGGHAEWYLKTADRMLILPGDGPATSDDEEDETRTPALYSKPDDRWEVNDIRARHVEEAETLEARLRAILGGEAPAGPA